MINMFHNLQVFIFLTFLIKTNEINYKGLSKKKLENCSVMLN